MVPHETKFLQAVFSDETQIDKATQAGLTARHFTDIDYQRLWQFICDLRLNGQGCDFTSVYTHAVKLGKLADFGGSEKLMEASSADFSSLGASASLASILEGYARREAWKTLRKASELLERESSSLSEVGSMVEGSLAFLAGKQQQHRTVSDIAAEAVKDAHADIKGLVPEGRMIYTGMPNFDRFATPMRSHEYCVVAGRSSHGKSSLMIQIAGHNLSLGAKVAIFSLETSDKLVVKQMAAQRAQVNLRALADEMPDRQNRYVKGLEYLAATKNLLVFDHDLTMDAIGARCRLLAQSFKPDLVILDYLSLIGGAEGTAYERMSQTSRMMIPLRKALNCVLMVGVQLNQGPEKDGREPGRTDFRDSGSILDDASRVIAVHRHPGQRLDQTVYDCSLLQLKLRDGGTAKVDCRFNAPHTRFYEEAHQ